MAWSTPRTWSNGEIVTQTMLNTDVRDNMRELWHEIAYTEFTANVSVGTTVVDIVSSGAITYAALPTIVEFYCYNVTSFSIGSATLTISLYDSATDQGVVAFTQQGWSGYGGGLVARRFTPSAASHTYKIRGVCSSGTVQVSAGVGGAATGMPGYIRVLQKGG